MFDFLKNFNGDQKEEEKRLRNLQRTISIKRVGKHITRIAQLIMEDYLSGPGKIPFKITLKRGLIYVSLCNKRLRISVGEFVGFASDHWNELIDFNQLMFISGMCDTVSTMVMRTAVYSSIADYEELLKKSPLFYQTLDMDDEEFKLWFILQ